MKIIGSVSLLFSIANSHSWLHCSDYDGTISGQDYDESLCNGYIREWDSYASSAFADDRGVNYQPNGAWCPKSIGTPNDYSDSYSSGSPMAQWTVGEEVTLVWPAKNHANYECFANIPDNSMKLYYNTEVNPSSDPTFTSTPASNDWTLLIDWQADCTPGTDGCGFQNCPSFCEETDDAPCFQKYTVSADDFSSSGVYTLMWYWEFNAGSYYTTCFEAYVDVDNVVTGDDDDDDDDTTNTGDDDDNNNNGDDDDDDDDDDDTSSSSDYIVTIPICYTGGDYSTSTLIDGANNAYSSGVVDWYIFTAVEYDYTDEDDNDYDWYVWIGTDTTDAPTVNSVAYDWGDESSDLCSSIEDEFDDGGSCVICPPGSMTTYILADSSASTSSSSDDDDGFGVKLTIGLIVAFLVVLSLLLFYVYKEKFATESKTESGMAKHVPQNSHVVSADTATAATR